MLIPFGILSAAGAGVGVAGDYELIETSILTSSASSVTFSNLGTYSSTYKHLQIRYTARTARAATDDDLLISFNGITTDYYRHQLYGGELSTAQSFGNVSRAVGFTTAANSTASNFGAGVFDILDAYATKNKTVRSLTGATDLNRIFLRSIGWFNTASITSIALSGASGNLVAGSRFSLYGVRG
jgi:hypothetical protein